jgi:hypothetical protein
MSTSGRRMLAFELIVENIFRALGEEVSDGICFQQG